MRRFVPAGVLGLLLLAAPARAFLEVSPGIVEVVVRPGGKAKGALRLRNPEDRALTVRVEVQEWWQSQTRLPSPPPSSWLRVKTKGTLRLAAGETKTLPYKIHLPNTMAGETAAMVFFSWEPGPGAGPRNVEMRQGIPIYALVSGRADVRAEIPEVSAYFSDASSTTLNLSARIFDRGNVHFRPRGTVSLTLADGSKESAPLDWGWPLYPGRDHWYPARIRRTDWPAGHYRALFQAQCGELLQKDVPVTRACEFDLTPDKTIVFRKAP